MQVTQNVPTIVLKNTKKKNNFLELGIFDSHYKIGKLENCFCKKLNRKLKTIVQKIKRMLVLFEIEKKISYVFDSQTGGNKTKNKRYSSKINFSRLKISINKLF